MKRLQAKKNRILPLYILASIFCVAATLLGVLLGSTELTFSDIFRVLCSPDPLSSEYRIFYYVRLPRPLAALICGAALAVSGAVIQRVLANRLASPSIIVSTREQDLP